MTRQTRPLETRHLNIAHLFVFDLPRSAVEEGLGLRFADWVAVQQAEEVVAPLFCGMRTSPMTT